MKDTRQKTNSVKLRGIHEGYTSEDEFCEAARGTCQKTISEEMRVIHNRRQSLKSCEGYTSEDELCEAAGDT